jgi:large subunit ribosomal protein L9
MCVYKSSLLVAVLVLSKAFSVLGRTSTISALFIAPAAPSVARSTPAPMEVAFARTQAVSSGYGLYPPSQTVLSSKKKAAGSQAPKKIQVKLLKHVAGTGQAGDVVLVTPSFLNNKLRSTKSAELISDEDVEKERSEAEQKENETKAKAEELQAKLSDLTLTVSRKAGPDGQLFGGIGAKVIVSELQDILGEEFLGEKGVKISELLDENGKKMRGDIKHTGEFAARIALMKGVSAKITVLVEDTSE